MAEIMYQVRTYEVDFKCDVCGKGFYRPTGTVLLTDPLQYPHKCTVCGSQMAVTGHTYPYTKTEKIEEATDELSWNHEIIPSQR